MNKFQIEKNDLQEFAVRCFGKTINKCLHSPKNSDSFCFPLSVVQDQWNVHSKVTLENQEEQEMNSS
jgi:hypothetical protein